MGGLVAIRPATVAHRSQGGSRGPAARSTGGSRRVPVTTTCSSSALTAFGQRRAGREEEWMPRNTRAAISLCGLPVRAENVRLLARRLEGDPLAQKLERAVTNDNSIVALSVEERTRIVAALTGGPAALVGLRTELAAQLERHKNHAEKLERAKRYREIEDRRATRRERQMDQPA